MPFFFFLNNSHNKISELLVGCAAAHQFVQIVIPD